MSTTAIEQSTTPGGGKLIDITDPAFKADPFPFYRSLRASHPVHRVRLGRMEAWLVTRYDDVLALLKDERFTKHARNVGGSKAAGAHRWMPAFLRPLESNMLDQDNPDHARLRGLVHKAFTPARIDHMQTRIQQIADDLLDKALGASGHGAIDLVRDFALPLPLTVIVELLGVPLGDQDLFTRTTRAMLRRPTTFNMLRAIPSIRTFMRYLRTLFNDRRASPRDDLVTALVQAEESGQRLSEDEVLGMIFLLLIAGHETTVNLIASGTLALLEHPGQLARLRESPALIKPAIEELLRYANPVETATERYAREDVEIAGTTIRRGDLTLAVLASANRDETVFAQPDELDIAREKNRHLAFGQGIHFCLGAPLARMEGQIAIASLLRRMPDLRLAMPANRLRWRATPMVRGLEALPLVF